MKMTNRRATTANQVQRLMDIEQRVIADMVANGYENPLTDKGHRACLIGEDPSGRTVRRFITEWGFGSDPRAGQVKEKQTNDEWVQELKERILQHGGLKFVPFKDQSNVIANGHTRKRCYREIVADLQQKEKLHRLKDYDYQMPWATITDTYVLDNSGKPVKNIDPSTSKALDLVSKIQANPPKENDDYTREGVITQIDMIFRMDNHCVGLNPSGGLLYDQHNPNDKDIRATFDAVMDYVYKKQSWTDKAQRTMIQKQLHKDHSCSKDIFPADINEEAVIRGWTSGLKAVSPTSKSKKKATLKTIGDWCSEDGRVLYASLGTAGTHLTARIDAYLNRRLRELSLNEIDRIKLVMYVNGSKTTVRSLMKARKDYIKQGGGKAVVGPEKLNREYAAYNRHQEKLISSLPECDELRNQVQKYPYIEEITFVNQLMPDSASSATDPGLHVRWNKEAERFFVISTGETI